MSMDAPSRTGKSNCPTDMVPSTGMKNKAIGNAINLNRPFQPSVSNQTEAKNISRFISNHNAAADLTGMNPR